MGTWCLEGLKRECTVTRWANARCVCLCVRATDFSGSNGRRESQGSLSSGASLELGTSGSGKNEVRWEGPSPILLAHWHQRQAPVTFLDCSLSYLSLPYVLCSLPVPLPLAPAPPLQVAERGASLPLRQCNISLPDGSCCPVPLRSGVSIRELLLGLCEKLCINLAAVDLFLVGGDKVESPQQRHVAKGCRGRLEY